MRSEAEREEGDKKMDKQVEKRKVKEQGQEREEVVIIATSAEKIFVLQKATAGWSKLSGGKISPFEPQKKVQKFFVLLQNRNSDRESGEGLGKSIRAGRRGCHRRGFSPLVFLI